MPPKTVTDLLAEDSDSDDDLDLTIGSKPVSGAVAATPGQVDLDKAKLDALLKSDSDSDDEWLHTTGTGVKASPAVGISNGAATPPLSSAPASSIPSMSNAAATPSVTSYTAPAATNTTTNSVTNAGSMDLLDLMGSSPPAPVVTTPPKPTTTATGSGFSGNLLDLASSPAPSLIPQNITPQATPTPAAESVAASTPSIAPTPGQASSIGGGSLLDMTPGPPPSSQQTPPTHPASDVRKMPDVPDLLSLGAQTSATSSVPASSAPPGSILHEQIGTRPIMASLTPERQATPPHHSTPPPVVEEQAPEPQPEIDFEEDPLEWGYQQQRKLLGSGDDDDADPVPARLGTLSRTDLVVTEGASSSTSAAVIMRSEPMHAARSQLTSLDAGRLACVACHEMYVAVGSSKGAVLLFDNQHNFKAVLQPSQNEIIKAGAEANPDLGAVTCLTLSRDGAALLAGHASGAILLWDCKDHKLLLLAPVVHPAPTGPNAGQVSIAACAFWAGTRHHAITSNAAGNVQILQYSQFLSMGVRIDSQPLLDSSPRIGAIIRILPLPSAQLYPGARLKEDGELDGLGMCAMVGMHAFLVVSLHPNPQLLHKMQYPATPEGVTRTPDACWLRPSGVRQGDGWASQDPVLAVVYGSSIHLVRSFIPDGPPQEGKPKVRHQNMGSFSWTAPIRTIHCLGETVVALYDANQKLNVIQLFSKMRPADDPAHAKAKAKAAQGKPGASPWIITHDCINTQDVAHLAIAARTGGHQPLVQSCLAAIPWVGKLYIAGQSLSAYSVIRWADTLDANVQKEQWVAALSTMIALFDGRLPPLLDFPPDASNPKKEIPRLASQFVQSFLSQAIKPGQTPENAREICEVAVEACVALSAWDVLYKTVFERFKQSGHVRLYLSCLEPYIMHRMLSSDHLDAEVFSSFLGEYGTLLENEEKEVMKTAKLSGGMLLEDGEDRPDLFPHARRLTQLVLRLAMERLDINHAIRIYTERRLWTALIYLYLHSLRDYASPLKMLMAETMERLKQAKRRRDNNEGSPERDDTAGNKVLRKVFFFLACTFEGQPFPLPGYGSEKQPLYSIPQLLNAIFEPPERREGQISSAAPVLFQRALHYSPPAFFNVMARLFSSPFAQRAVERAGDAGQRIGDPPEEMTLQWILTLSQKAFMACRKAIEDGNAPASLPSLPENIEDHYLVFLATASTHAKLKLDAEILPNISRCLLRRGDSEKSELLLLELIKLYQAPWMLGPKMVQHAHTVKFFQLASWLHEQRNEFGDVLDCRAKAKEGKVFEYITQVVGGYEGADVSEQHERVAEMGTAVMDRVPQLAKVDAVQFADLMLNRGLDSVHFFIK